MSRTPPTRRGFTLVEMVVALVIAGLVVLAAHGVLAAAIEEAGRVVSARAELDRRENAARWLAQAIESIDVDSAGSFVGTTEAVEFSTRLLVPYGWHEPDRVSIRLENHRLVSRLASGGRFVLADSVAAVGFDYLIESGETAPWLGRWESSVNPPQAIRLRLDHVPARAGEPECIDTTLFAIGGRG